MEDILIKQNHQFINSLKDHVIGIKDDLTHIRHKAELMKVKHKFEHLKESK